MMLLKVKKLHGYRLFQGWVDYAARKNELVNIELKAIYRGSAPRGSKFYSGNVEYLMSVEKNSATMAVLQAKQDSDTNPLLVFSHDTNRYVELTEYLKIRAERKAKKLAAKAEAAEAKPAPGKVNIFAIACDGGILGTLTHLMVAGTLEEAKAKFEKAHPDETVKSIELQEHPFADKNPKAFPKGKVN